jgi:flagellar protein FliO/FliZ
LRRLAAFLTCLPAAAVAAAADAPAAAPPLPGAGTAAAQVALSLLVVLGLVAALAWMLRRLRLAPRASSGSMRIAADIALGPRERLVLLQVGDRQALVGVSNAGIHSIELLSTSVQLGEVAAGPPSPLTDKLRAMLERGGRP